MGAVGSELTHSSQSQIAKVQKDWLKMGIHSCAAHMRNTRCLLVDIPKRQGFAERGFTHIPIPVDLFLT